MTLQVNNQTGEVMRFLTEPMMAPGMHYQSLAASLITVGEGAALQAYPDPAKDAGKNIGMGYNLKANGSVAPFELRRAGVPEDDVYPVMSGTKQLTPDQAMRLLKLSLSRYEQQVMDVAEKTAPGLWSKMTPTQKAVMIDIAYQTGNPAQFQTAWKAMSSGNMEAFNAAAKVHYKDKDGNMIEDKRRNALRASMLQGIPQWEAVVQRYAGLPGNALDSAKVGQ